MKSVEQFPLVSVIIPLFNSEKFISETIQSVLNQTYPVIEILVIDDGSSDNTLEIAKTFKNKHVKIFSQPNKGASAARNYGIREASGTYIQFLDSDDFLSSGKIEEQVKLLVEHPNKVALCPTIHFFNGDDRLKLKVVHEWYKEDTIDPIDFLIKLYGGDLIGPNYGGMIQPNAWLTPKKIIEKAGLWNEEITVDDDGEFFCRVLLASNGIRYAESAVNYYRKFTDNKNLSARKDRKASASALLATQLKESALLSATSDIKAKLAIARYYWEIAFNSYPYFKDISLIAEKRATELGLMSPLFFKNGMKKILSYGFGWKFVKKIMYLKETI